MELALGTMRASGHFNSLMVVDRDPEESAAFLRAAVRAGVQTLDTAPIYARGLAEQDIGTSVPPTTAVWTKVGVDISPSLPRLDYSTDGMLRSLRGSLERLRRDLVQTVFVHNPPLKVLADLDLLSFRDLCVDAGLAFTVGISLLQPEVALPAVVHRLPADAVLMVEAAQLAASPEAEAMLAGRPLVVRSLFGGGCQLRDLSEPARRQAIANKLVEVEQRWAPIAAVIGPRTVRQLSDYPVRNIRVGGAT